MVEPLTLIQTISYFWDLTFKTEVLWNIIPLAIATIVILMYFERYKQEKEGWNSYLSNSFVLLFVSVALFRYIYSINGVGTFNFVEYLGKTLATGLLLLIGLILLRFNFEHVLPERFSKHLSSPLTINLSALGVILFVFSSIKFNFLATISLIILILILTLIFYLIKFPIRTLKKLIEKERKQERFKNIKEAVYEIDELKRELKTRDKELNKIRLKKADEQKQESIKLKKIIRKEKLRKK